MNRTDKEKYSRKVVTREKWRYNLTQWTKRFKWTDDDVYYKLESDSNTVNIIILLTSGKINEALSIQAIVSINKVFCVHV